jgi:hypothetical protein
LSKKLTGGHRMWVMRAISGLMVGTQYYRASDKASL